jgi:nitroimidazol reductase NimA-like FMN-containing flavoprotein (pyridoxamine 5'-phosphate oxidase superfamily)
MWLDSFCPLKQPCFHKGVYEMIEKMKDLVRGKDTCVLATVSDNKPHCSLMSYVTDADCREIYMVTHRETKKYHNLLKNSAVSLLIDTRAGNAPGSQPVVTAALTINGMFQKMEEGTKKENVCAKLLKKHPGLREFIVDPDSEIIAVCCQSFQLLEGIRDSYFITLE